MTTAPVPDRLRCGSRGYSTVHADVTYDVWDDDRPGVRVALVYRTEDRRFWVARTDTGDMLIPRGLAVTRSEVVAMAHRELLARAATAATVCEHCGGDGCMWCTRSATALEVLEKWDADEAAIAARAAPPAPPERVAVHLTLAQWAIVHQVCANAATTMAAVLGADAAPDLNQALPVLADAAAGIEHPGG